jgi:nicotinamidase/pyrazinamidase
MRALLVIDVQYDFMPGGGLAVPNGDEIVPLVNRLMDRFDHVVLTQDWHPRGHSSFASSHAKEPFEMVEMEYGEQILWPDHCIQGSRGAALHADLKVERAELILRKGFNPQIDSYSAFFENDGRTPTGLTGYLREREIESLYLVGLAFDFCVHWSAVDGREQGFEVVVVEDAARAIDTEGSLERARMRMGDAGVRLIPARDVPAAA